jgi:hypothetical protein
MHASNAPMDSHRSCSIALSSALAPLFSTAAARCSQNANSGNNFLNTHLELMINRALRYRSCACARTHEPELAIAIGRARTAAALPARVLKLIIILYVWMNEVY